MTDNDAPPIDPRKRMQQLLAIPDRDRSDEEWDELIELEIQFAPGNRAEPGSANAIPGAPAPARSRHNNKQRPGGKQHGKGNPQQGQQKQPRPQGGGQPGGQGGQNAGGNGGGQGGRKRRRPQQSQTPQE